MSTPEKFPILQADESGRRAFGSSVPWHVLEVVRGEALRYHSQTLERLAQRGGLAWSEIGNLFVEHFKRHPTARASGVPSPETEET